MASNHGAPRPESLEDIRQAFSKFLGPKYSIEKLYELYERDGELVAHQVGHIDDSNKWMKVFNYAKQHGRHEKNDRDRTYYFFFSKPVKKVGFPDSLDEPEKIVKEGKLAAGSEPEQKPPTPEEPEPTGEPLYLREGPDPPEQQSDAVEPRYYPDFPVDRIQSSPFSFRLNMEEGIGDLIGQIHTAGMIIEPLVCRPASKGDVQVGAGERRLRAAREMAMRTVPIMVKEFSDAEFDKMRLMENLARKDLTNMEIARILDHMLTKYEEEYPTKTKLANAFGKTLPWAIRHLNMLELEKDRQVLKNLPRGRVEKLTERQAREILSAPPEKRGEVAKQIAEQIEAEGEIPSARDIHAMARPEAEEPAEPEPELEEVEPSLPTPAPAPAEPTELEWSEEDVEKVVQQIRENIDFWKTGMCKRDTAEIHCNIKKDVPQAKAIIDSLLEQDILSVPKPGYIEFAEPEEEKPEEPVEPPAPPTEEKEKKAVLDHLRGGTNAAEWVLIDKYNFDANRGLETYKISEIKKLVKENGPTKTFLKDLRECVDRHKKFYAAYHDQAKFTPIKNDVATENIDRIDRYVEVQELKKVKPFDYDSQGKSCPLCGGPMTPAGYERKKKKYAGTPCGEVLFD